MKILEVTFLDSTSDKVLARADVHFEGFTLKGFKVFRDNKKREFVTPPSYQSKSGWRSLFKTDTLEQWKEICNVILEEFNKKLMNESLESK